MQHCRTRPGALLQLVILTPAPQLASRIGPSRLSITGRAQRGSDPRAIAATSARMPAHEMWREVVKARYNPQTRFLDLSVSVVLNSLLVSSIARRAIRMVACHVCPSCPFSNSALGSCSLLHFAFSLVVGEADLAVVVATILLAFAGAILHHLFRARLLARIPLPIVILLVVEEFWLL